MVSDVTDFLGFRYDFRFQEASSQAARPSILHIAA